MQSPAASEQHPSQPGKPLTPPPWRRHCLLVPALLLLAAILAITSLVGDSITYDETSHLTAGMSYLLIGDYRLAPDHPPLAKLWCAWPLLLVDHEWPAADDAAWRAAAVFSVGREWLFELNDGQRLLIVGRCMMVVLLLATCLTVYALARGLFGPVAGLLALTLAALSPNLLAHGRLVTTDLPITLCVALVLLTLTRLARHISWPRLIAAALAMAAASVTKLSWPLVLPAAAVMALVAIARPNHDAPATTVVVPEAGAGPGTSAKSLNRLNHAAAITGCALFMALFTWLGIWTCYVWSSTIIPPPGDVAGPPATTAEVEHTIETLRHAWQRALRGPADGSPRRGLVPALLRPAADHGLLPEAYLFGLASTLESTGVRSAYLMGEYSNVGWRSYFPIAAAIKTPLPTLLLLGAGLAALFMGKARSRDPVLLSGLVVFALVFGGYLINSRLNIGHRHLLPLYPVLFVFAGGAAAWLAKPAGRVLVGAAVLWLAGANIWIHPHYLAYFNELIGGPARGHRHLADSNIDWGQDLLRLADYAREHPNEPIKLAYFGSGKPTYYVDCTALPSNDTFEPTAELAAGTYVVSVTQYVGVYDVEIRDEFWTPEALRAYATLGRVAAAPAEPDETPEARQLRLTAAKEYESLRARLLLTRLREHEPDERIGWSLLVYRLSDADIERLTSPNPL